MPQQQRLIRMDIKRLKNLSNVSITFEEDIVSEENKPKRLVAIMGPNGFGKSTVLHALAASFKPTPVPQISTIPIAGEDHNYTKFFPNTPHGTWANTSFSIVHFYREEAKPGTKTLQVSKGIGQWLPIPSNKPERETYFIGISSVTPAIEEIWHGSKVNYTTQDLGDDDSLKIQKNAGYIMNRDYTRYHNNKVTSQRSLIGVEFQGVNFSALSMGAGEQRLFKILQIVQSAGKYALILIDELDLLLHTDALNRCLEVLKEYADAKSLQIIFTTHRESVVDFESFIAIRHLYRTPNAPYKTFCFNDTKPDAIERLTGEILRPLSLCCEDEMATAILEKVAQQAGIGKFIEISKFGAAINCFTLAAALSFNPPELAKSLFVLDGDQYKTHEARQKCIEKVLTGTENDLPRRWQKALDRIVQFCPQKVHCPEQALYEMIISVDPIQSAEENEVIAATSSLSIEQDSKIRMGKVIDTLGGGKDRSLVRIIDVAAKSAHWPVYVKQVRDWLDQQKSALVEASA